MIYRLTVNSPVGPLTIMEKDEKIYGIHFGNGLQCGTIKETKLICTAIAQLNEYFCGARRIFDLPLAPEGTEFQLRVWDALTKIPYGTTASYKDIAVMCGSPKASRAVGMANHNNPISIVIPCHRVIGSDGSLVGYGGGIDKKIALLKIEGLNF